MWYIQYVVKVECILDRVDLVAKVSDRKQLKMLTSKKVLQRLPIALAEVKAGNTSENILNKIRNTIYSMHLAK